ncbi:MAG: ABC transporter ATP-binding protein [Lachnospiraceae bacterium]
MSEKIQIKNVSFDYIDKKTRFEALQDINLNIHQGEFVCILGSSGCGKSTLLSLLSGLNHAKKGEILVDDRQITGPGIDRAVVFQQYSLFPWLTVKGNVIFGIKQSGKKYSRKEREALADKYIESVGLTSARDRYPSQLSGGMKQRVAVARALALESDILLMDEPFGAIDPKLRLELQELISRLCVENKKTVVFITHDVDEAILLADRIVVMEPGRIRNVLKVKLAHPRVREELIRTDEYEKLHRQLILSFYDHVEESIDAGVTL